MGLLRTVRRSLRKWRTLVFIVGLFLLVQILLTFETGTSSVEEHHLKKSNSVHRDEDNIRMANAMLEGKESLIGINRRALDVLNPKDPRIREAFLQQLSQHDQAGILEEETQNKANQLEVMEPNGPNDYHPNEYEFDELAKDDVEYKPTCEITLTDANSAISRANSNTCKQEIADIACKLQNETLFPKSIPRYCKLDPKHASSAPVPSLYPENAPLARICYMLVVHGRAFRQFSRLLKTIYHRDHFYYIHVDKRSDFLLREIVRETEKYPNVKVTSWRMATIWGGSSLLQMLLHAISDALYVWKQWDFFVNLSALDFPVETGDNLAKYLATYRSKNFMKSHGRDDAKFIQKQGLNKVFVECEQHMWRLGPRTLPEGITISGGSDWVALNRELCQYAVKGNDQLLSDLKYWYKYTLLPAESFFHTLTKNSEQCDTFVDNNLRVTNWNRARGCKCQYKHIVDWCGCSPNDFYPSDLGRLKTTRPVFFARKFEEIVNQEVVNHLDFKLYGQYPPGTPSLHSYWENVYDRLDGPTSVRDVMLTQYTAYARMGLSDVNRQSRDKVRELGVEGVGLTNCDLRFNKLVQVEVHKRNEELVGYLATMDAGWLSSRDGSERGVAESDQSFVRVQALLTPHQPLRIIDPASALAGRLQSALVGTEWDVKELVLRDWGGVIGPESDCHLVARWRRGDDDFVVTVVVIDPLNVVNDYNDFRTPTKSAGVTETPLSLRKPLRTGRWVARFYVQRQFHKACAELEFHVVPLQFKDGAEGDGRLKSINAGILDDSQVNSANRNLYSIRTTLNLVRDQRLANQIAANSEHVTGAPLRAWVDHTVAGAWAVKDVCLVSMGNRTAWGSTGCTHPRLTPPNRCEHMSWSSFSPDPKSHLGVVKRNGRIR